MPKTAIHPTYHQTATITCSCGEVHTIGSTKDTLRVDICKSCHPFYSGTQKLIDTAGRVDRFREKMAKAVKKPEAKKAEPVAEASAVETVEEEKIEVIESPEAVETETAAEGESIATEGSESTEQSEETPTDEAQSGEQE